jgi:hypothetical protein
MNNVHSVPQANVSPSRVSVDAHECPRLVSLFSMQSKPLVHRHLAHFHTWAGVARIEYICIRIRIAPLKFLEVALQVGDRLGQKVQCPYLVAFPNDVDIGISGPNVTDRPS